MNLTPDRRTFLGTAVAAMAASGPARAIVSGTDAPLRVTAGEVVGTIDPIWRRCVGSDRASVASRAEWQQDLKRVHDELGVERVRFHNAFGDELGVFATPFRGAAKPSFLHLDAVYDAVLACGVKPYIELGFMPSALASGEDTVFSYRANVTPPRDEAEWADFISQFARHLIGRYGIDEVSRWLFEVWNEPNLPAFWTGGKQGYFDLYRVTARALKAVDARLQVGGPSTAQAAWIADFLGYCTAHQLPLDFVSTHSYPFDPQTPIFGHEHAVAPEDLVPSAVRKVRGIIDASAFKAAPLWLSEWSSESPALIAHIVTGCLGNVTGMSYWTFSGVFEELGPAQSIFGDGEFTFGLIGLRGIPKPSFHAFSLLDRLGTRRLKTSPGPFLATRRDDGTVVALVWNVGALGMPSGVPGEIPKSGGAAHSRSFDLEIDDTAASRARITVVDMEHGSARGAWVAMGSPSSPTQDQLAQLRAAAALPTAVEQTIAAGRTSRVSVMLPSDGLALVEYLA